MLTLSIIIVNYNVKEFLRNLLDSIYKSSDKISKEVIVIDNASDDGSLEMIKENYPSVNLIESKKNLGFGKANNLGLEIAKGKFLLLINPDTIVQEDTFEKMIRFFESHDDVGMAGCKVLNPDGSLQLACRRGFPSPWTSFTKVSGLSSLFPKSRIFAKYNLTYLDENQTYEVDAISGAFMMFRKEVYENIGGFDPVFFMYGEDLDLCYRTQKAGYKVFYVHSTSIIHYKGESTKRSNLDETKLFYDAMHLFVKKHFATSFFVEMILRLAIIIRKFFAFMNINKFILVGVFFDFIFFNISILLAENIYTSNKWHGFPTDKMFIIFSLPAIIQIVIASSLGSYKKNTLSVLRIILSLIVGFFFLSSLTFFLKDYGYSRVVLVLTFVLATFALVIWRLLVKAIFKWGIINDGVRYKTLIVGTGNSAISLAKKLGEKKTIIHNIIGLVGDSRKLLGEQINGYNVIGFYGNIRKVIIENNINEVIFPADEISYGNMFAILSEVSGLNVDFKVTGGQSDFLVGKSTISIIDDIPLLKVQYNIFNFTNRLVKFLFDYSFALFLLIFIYPFNYLFTKFKSRKNEFNLFIEKIPYVLSGKYSFVGPMNSGKKNNIYLGKPGLTGYWFTESIRDEDLSEMDKLNIYYAKNQNFWLDLEILGNTFSRFLN